VARRRAQAAKPLFDQVDDWLDRIQIVDENDDEVARFLDGLDLRGPQEREMLQELARKGPLAKPADFPAAHRRAVLALEALGRHGYRFAVLPGWIRPKVIGRFFVELVSRYVVVSYLRRVSTDMRNLYWLRAMAAAVGTPERPVLRRSRLEAEGLIVVFNRRQLGLPSFVVGGILLPIVLTLVRVARGIDLSSWWALTVVAVVGGLVVLLVSTVMLRGAAIASRRIRLATRAPLDALWATIGSCGHPPHDQSRKFAIIAIVLTALAWVVIPAIVVIAVLT
jgi:hypothetical protein